MAKSSAKTSAAAPVSRPVKKGDHVFLVDGSGYIFRAYHALPPLNRKSDGLQVNAVLGFCNMLWKLLRDMKPEDKPTHLAVIFDKSEHTFRNELYKDYKAHRPDAPGDLIPQFPLIREAVRAFDIPCLEMLGFEADDLIATYARQACEVGANVTIVSSDKDLMQLVNDCVIMYDTMKDKKIGVAEVIEKFGVPPEKVIEVQSLIGDSTDNVPGVPGIGVKTAAQLIGEFGDLETLLRRAGEIKQEKRRQSLIEHAEKARISKVLVTLDQNVKLEVPLADLAVHEPDYKLLIAFLKQMEFSTPDAARRGIRQSGCRRDRSVIGRGGQPAQQRHRALTVDLARPAAQRRRHGGQAASRCDGAGCCRHAAAARGRAAGSGAHLEDRARRATKSSATPTVSKPGLRAPTTQASWRSTSRRSALTRCRRRCAASRWRSRPTRPVIFRSRTARPATGTDCSAAGCTRNRYPRRRRSPPSSRCWRSAASSRSD